MVTELVDRQTSDASPVILLHPIALVTINDHVTRSSVRHHGPIIGALLGRHDGKEVTIEQTFECGSKKVYKNEESIDADWFNRMLKLQVEIFPGLSLVGWYTVGLEPQAQHVSLHTQFRDSFECDSAIFLLYQPQTLDSSNMNDPLPLTLYEMALAPASISPQSEDVSSMEVDHPKQQAAVRFRVVPYFLETPADEAIVLADIMQGATAATAVAGTDQSTKFTGKLGEKEQGRTKDILTAEEDELLGAYRTKANAIKMLQSRINLIIAYLQSQPASYLSDASLSPADTAGQIDHEVIRAITSLAAQSKLTSTLHMAELCDEIDQSSTDSQVLDLLATMTKNSCDIKTLGRRLNAAERRKRKDTIGMTAGLESMLSQDWT